MTSSPTATTCLASVVIPVFNGADDHLGETLAALMDQQLSEPFEVIAIDSGSTDNSVAILQSFVAGHPNFRLFQIPNSEYSHGGTRQWAAELANGKYVVYLSQDAVPANPQWLANMISGFSYAAKVGGVLGRQKPRPNCFPLQKHEINRAFAAQGPDDVYTLYDANSPDQQTARFYSDVCAAAPRELLLGPLPYQPINYAEDQAFGIDLIQKGYTKVYAGPAVVIHSNDIKLREYARRMYDEFKGLENSGITFGRPTWRQLVGGMVKEARTDAARARSDAEYSKPRKLYFMLTAPLYRFARWYGQLRATVGTKDYSLETTRKLAG